MATLLSTSAAVSPLRFSVCGEFQTLWLLEKLSLKTIGELNGSAAVGVRVLQSCACGELNALQSSVSLFLRLRLCLCLVMKFRYIPNARNLLLPKPRLMEPHKNAENVIKQSAESEFQRRTLRTEPSSALPFCVCICAWISLGLGSLDTSVFLWLRVCECEWVSGCASERVCVCMKFIINTFAQSAPLCRRKLFSIVYA